MTITVPKTLELSRNHPNALGLFMASLGGCVLSALVINGTIELETRRWGTVELFSLFALPYWLPAVFVTARRCFFGPDVLVRFSDTGITMKRALKGELPWSGIEKITVGRKGIILHLTSQAWAEKRYTWDGFLCAWLYARWGGKQTVTFPTQDLRTLRLYLPNEIARFLAVHNSQAEVIFEKPA